MKRVLSLALGLLIAFAGLKIYLHHEFKKNVDLFVEAAMPFASIEYDNLSTSLLHRTVTLKQLQILPNGSVAPILVKAIKFHDVSLFDQKLGWFRSQDWTQPSRQGVSIEDLQINLDEQLKYGNLSQSARNKGADPEFLNHLGYHTLVVNLGISLENKPAQNQILISYQQNHKDMFDLQFDAMLKLADTPSNQNSNLELVQASFRLQDQSFFERYFNYLAKQKGLSVDATKEDWLKRLKTSLAEHSLVLDDHQLQVVHSFIFDLKPITLSIQPQTPLDQKRLSTLYLYKPKDVKKILNLTLSNM